MDSNLIPPKEIIERLARAVAELLADSDLCNANPGEQAVTGALAHRMAAYFPEWSVSPEWDRRGVDQKMLHYGFEGAVKKLRAIRPDIIVHQIGQNENVLVLEAKRVENADRARDIAKLIAMTSPEGGYTYSVGVHLVVDLSSSSIPECAAFTMGSRDIQLSDHLRKLLPGS